MPDATNYNQTLGWEVINKNDYVFVKYETIERVRSMEDLARKALLLQATEDDWFLETPENKECSECYKPAFGTFFPLVGEPIYDKDAYDVVFCQECFLATYIERTT